MQSIATPANAPSNVSWIIVDAATQTVPIPAGYFLTINAHSDRDALQSKKQLCCASSGGFG
jgi:hypothetical protein